VQDVSSAASDLELVSGYCDAWLAGDAIRVLSYYHDDLILEWPGRHRFAGAHSGLQASIEALAGLQEATNRIPMEVVDLLIGSRGVAASLTERWSRAADDGVLETLEHSRVLYFTITGGQLRTCRIYKSAQSEVDEWLREHGQPRS